MNIRTKLILSMTSVVLLMVILFIFLIQILFFISRDISYFANKEEIEKVENFMEDYFKRNNSWEGIQKEEFPTDMPFVLIDRNHNVLWKSEDLVEQTVINTAFPTSLKDGSQRIGRLFVMTPTQQQIYIVKNTWGQYMYGIIALAAIIGLFFVFILILLLSRTLTKPINIITENIKNYEMGDSTINFQMKRNDEFNKIGDALESMKQNIKNAEISRKSLVTDVAHELKTPLMVIQGEIELLHIQQKTITNEKYDSIFNEIQRLTAIINDLLYLSKIDARQVEITKQKVDVNEVFDQLVEKTQFLLNKYNAEITFKKNNVQIIWADKDKIIQSLYNLVTNALIHGKTTTKIIIETNNNQNETVITVTDNGIGLACEDIQLIFERFYRGDKSRSRETGGTGIGLSIVKAYIELHKGRIEVESQVGKGTTFMIYLPNP
ncbi:sensor histidine kinase [Bacillus sp. JJ1562]|uniref:sensor histidine kinase n=1 Tax=Bacillus sp. JJ1562 TaxID=3122960 RepID=UPI00300182C4